jgi:hypothetical protein
MTTGNQQRPGPQPRGITRASCSGQASPGKPITEDNGALTQAHAHPPD